MPRPVIHHIKCFKKGNETYSAGLLQEETFITGGLAASQNKQKNKIPATYWTHGQIVHQFIKNGYYSSGFYHL